MALLQNVFNPDGTGASDTVARSLLTKWRLGGQSLRAYQARLWEDADLYASAGTTSWRITTIERADKRDASPKETREFWRTHRRLISRGS